MLSEKRQGGAALVQLRLEGVRFEVDLRLDPRRDREGGAQAGGPHRLLDAAVEREEAGELAEGGEGDLVAAHPADLAGRMRAAAAGVEDDGAVAGADADEVAASGLDRSGVEADAAADLGADHGEHDRVPDPPVEDLVEKGVIGRDALGDAQVVAADDREQRLRLVLRVPSPYLRAKQGLGEVIELLGDPAGVDRGELGGSRGEELLGLGGGMCGGLCEGARDGR